MASVTKKINKVLVANRGEIAIRIFRACTELDIRTVAIYSKEDIGSFHRYKADESYLVGEGKKPIEAYLDIEGIIKIAKAHEVDAIHPGYGFLSENVEFAKRCEDEGIIFIGPKLKHLEMFGDKVKARHQAILADIPVIPGSDGPIKSLEEAKAFGQKYGYPVIIKAARRIMAYRSGGGFGVRMDAGNGFNGAVITPYYDSLLVKVTTWALTFDQTAAKMVRNLREFRIRGIRTNIPFLEKVVKHPKFIKGEYDTSFIDKTPELFVFPQPKDRGTKMLSYIGNVTVNGFPGVAKKKKPLFEKTRLPKVHDYEPIPDGTKQILDEKGPEGVVNWIKEQKGKRTNRIKR
ncbi:hypothetical protein J7E95_11005 [Streptomyces sp. ISL-14]|nr:hypothetical protein [Streptomyces sp. ISL-14]